MLVWWVVAHNSGSGWVQVLGDAVFGILLIGLFAPGIALSRIRVQLVHAPSDAVAGMPLPVQLQTSGRTRITPVNPAGPEVFVGRTRDGDGGGGGITLLPQRRGVHESIVVEIATAAPFGLQWWTRQILLPFPTTLYVAPRIGRPIQLPNRADERAGDLAQALLAEAGDARGVREYRPGDRRYRVHWVATAHAGRVMVREMEEPSAQPINLQVVLPSEQEAAERAAEDALATTVAALDRGVSVVMTTDEASGPVSAIVNDRRMAGRRLARAIAANGPT